MPENQKTPEELAAEKAAADEKARQEKEAAEAAADEKKRIAEHTKAERPNWVTVKKGGERLEINKAVLPNYIGQGWKLVE